MIRLAIRNLFQNRTRLIISVGGVALALMLILSLDGIVRWIQTRVAAYIDASEADIWVAQAGVRNMHMASSSLSSERALEVGRVEGVDSVTPILYLTNVVVAGEERTISYIIGLPDEAQAGNTDPHHGTSVKCRQERLPLSFGAGGFCRSNVRFGCGLHPEKSRQDGGAEKRLNESVLQNGVKEREGGGRKNYFVQNQIVPQIVDKNNDKETSENR